MKQIISILIIILIIACGGGNKKPQETNPLPHPNYIFQAPTQEILDSGKAIFHTYCYICHENAMDEVTMLTNKTHWTENRTKEIETLVQHVHDGYTGNFGTMPPKGACMECSKEDLRNAVIFMMNETGVWE